MTCTKFVFGMIEFRFDLWPSR